MKRIFVDSSVLFTAVNSPAGGSSKLFTIKEFQLVTSPVVLAEVERNIRKKLTDFQLGRFFRLISLMQVVVQMPRKPLIEKAKKIIVEKDAVILAEAKKAKTDILVTLDRKHFLKDEVFDFLKPQEVLTPKLLLESLK